jgi:hypothetical protein
VVPAIHSSDPCRKYDSEYDHTREDKVKRVTVTLPEAIVEEIDRFEANRSRFLLVAAERELEWRRRQELERSLRSPHAECDQVSDAGLHEWGQGWRAGDDDLVDPSAGRPVLWTPGEGWNEVDE